MSRFIPRSLVTAVILAAVSACGHAVPAPPPIPFYEPDVALRDVRLRGVGLFGGTLDLWMRVYNPNDYDIMSPRVDYVVVVDRVQVASGYADLDVVVPARDSVEVRVPAGFRYADLGPAGQAIVGQGAAMYHVMGRVSVSTPYGPRSFPYDRAGQYGMLDARWGPPRRDDSGYDRDARGRAYGHDGHEQDGGDPDHGDGGDRDHGGGREHAPGLVPVQGPPPRDHHDGASDGGGDPHDHGSAHGADAPCRDARSDARGRNGRGACASGSGAGPADHPGGSGPSDAAPPRDTSGGPDGHQPAAGNPRQHEPRVGNPGDGRQPGPVPPRRAPERVEHPPVVAPVHPVGGAATPPSHDSSAHSSSSGGKPCPPPEPKGRGESGAHQHDRRVPPPCTVSDSGAAHGTRQGPAHVQR